MAAKLPSRIDTRFESIREKKRGPDNIAKFLLKWPTRCLDHEDAVASFCLDHNQLVCNVCVLSNHKKCSAIMGLIEASKGMRGSREVTLLDANLKKLKLRYEKALATQIDTINNLQEQDKEFSKMIRSFRNEINAVLDQLENAVTAKKDDFVARKKDIVKANKMACKTAISTLETYNKELDRAFLGSDEQQLFLATKKTRTVLLNFEEQFKQIDKEPKRVTIEFQPNGTIDRFFMTLKEFGTVKVDEASRNLLPNVVNKSQERRFSLISSERLPMSSNLEMRSERGRRSLPNLQESMAQLTLTSPHTARTRRPLPVGEVSVHLDNDPDIPFITGVTFMPDDRVVIADDANKNVKLLSLDYKPIAMAKLVSPPLDVAPVKSTQVVVTIPSEKCLQFIDLGKPMLLRKKLQLEIECSGITFYENELYITSGFSAERKIQVVSLNGDVRRQIRPGLADLRYPLYLTVDPKFKTIFVTDYNHGVIGIDLISGEVKFKCKDTDVHGYYKGITMGNKGNIYTCTWNLHGISRVHLDGRGLETIVPMPDKEGRKPYSIAYSKKSAKLVVSLCGRKRACLTVFKFQ